MELNLAKIDWEQEPSAREKVYFFLILILIVFAFARLLWLPTFAKIKVKKQEIENVKMQVSTLEKFIKINKKIEPQKKVQTTKGVNVGIESVLEEMPDDPQEAIAKVIQEITSRRSLGSATLESVSFKSPVAQTGYAAVPILLSVEGTFSALQNYLSRLEKIRYLFTVDNIIFKGSDLHPGLIKADLKCNLYVGAIKGLSLIEGAATGDKKGQGGKKKQRGK